MICSRAPHQYFITKPFRSPASLRWLQGIMFSLTGLKVLSSRTAPILYLVVFLFLGSGIPVLQTLPWKHRQWARSASSVCTLFFFTYCVVDHFKLETFQFCLVKYDSTRHRYTTSLCQESRAVASAWNWLCRWALFLHRSSCSRYTFFGSWDGHALSCILMNKSAR